jgi:hypothetical protein
VCFDSCVFSAYCGAAVNRFGPDFLVSSISSESLDWPRTLVEGGVVNGIVQQHVTCGDPIDCQTKCERFARTARDGGTRLTKPLVATNKADTICCVYCSQACPCRRIAHFVTRSAQPISARPSWMASSRCQLTWEMQ